MTIDLFLRAEKAEAIWQHVADPNVGSGVSIELIGVSISLEGVSGLVDN